jgi:hypothetical protein
MANPNIVAVTTINGKTAVANVANTAIELVVNTAGSNKVFKLNTLIISNTANTNTGIDIDIYRSNVAYHLAKNITVPSDASIDVLSKSVYLEEGDVLRVTAAENDRIQSVCSYEEIS